LTWQWNFWIQLIFGVAVQAVHLFMPESRSTILIDREAKRRRESGEEPNVYGPNELKSPRISLKEAGKIWMRPFEMFVREPIVLFLSLLSGFSDALIFTFLEAFNITFTDNFGFGTLQVAWALIPINASYFFTYFLYWPWFWRDDHLRKKNGPDWMSPERRLKPLLLLALFEPIGLFGFAWTCIRGLHDCCLWSLRCLGNRRQCVCTRLARRYLGYVCCAPVPQPQRDATFRVCHNRLGRVVVSGCCAHLHLLLEGT
jgi:hypothetical protein